MTRRGLWVVSSWVRHVEERPPSGRERYDSLRRVVQKASAQQGMGLESVFRRGGREEYKSSLGFFGREEQRRFSSFRLLPLSPFRVGAVLHVP